MLQISGTNNQVFDVIVVGSGATGGWAAKELTEAGLKVAVLEAGPKITPKDFTEHVQPYQLKYRGNDPHMLEQRPIQGLVYACRESNQQWFVNDIENPYTTPKTSHSTGFECACWADARSHGADRATAWAISTSRPPAVTASAKTGRFLIAKWSRSTSAWRSYIGISGQEENLEVLPDSVFQPPMAMTCGEEVLRDSVKKKMGRTVTIGRVAILTKPLNGRQPCHYCGPCEQGCITFSYYSSPWTTLKAAGDDRKSDSDHRCGRQSYRDGQEHGQGFRHRLHRSDDARTA